MSEGQTLARSESPRAVTLAEHLTAQFYLWELRGRGWQLWDAPVSLEPPFRPFYYHLPAPVPGHLRDDARKPTLLSTLAEGLRRLFSKPSVEVETFQSVPEPTGAWEEEPEVLLSDEPITELRLTVPTDLKVRAEAADQLLLAGAPLFRPASFEVVGTGGRIEIRIACRESDRFQLIRQLRAQFPEAALDEADPPLSKLWEGGGGHEPVIVDFGLAHEFMRPLRTVSSFTSDPLAAVVGALSDLQDGEVGVLQVLFQCTRESWSESAMRAVTDARGRSFFVDDPEMLPLAREKLERPLFAAAIRVGARSADPDRAGEVARALGAALTQFSRPPSNQLIPLAQEHYSSEMREADLLGRRSHRSGMLLSSAELVSLVHPPSAAVRSEKLVRRARRTRGAPERALGHRLVLGENEHAGTTRTVSLDGELRVRHTYLVGASGTGKSHLLASLLIQDLDAGRGVGVLDPHGDLVDLVLGHVPDERLKDVVVFDPADGERPVGFNILEARSASEKNLLASDMVAVFQRLSTSWGDRMTAVLSNAVLAFLESETGGTLADLRRFLTDPPYRTRFIETVRDPEVRYFWQREYRLLGGRSEASLLTRLGGFLRHPLIRHVVAQKENGLDLGEAMREGKIVLAKLSQGQIGEENAHLLGTLLVSKFHQLAMARQDVSPGERRPFYLYIDEFHNFATPSMAHVLSSARKYRLGLVLAHQDLEQIRGEAKLLGAVLTNPAVRVCFRVSERDARKLEEGFSSFDARDLQELGVGEAVCRIERADWDFNLRTLPLPALDPETGKKRRQAVLGLSRERHGTPLEEVRAALGWLEERTEPAPEAPEVPETGKSLPTPEEALREAEKAERSKSRSTVETRQPPPPAPELPPMGRGGPEHTYLQNLVKRLAESRGWRTTIEKPVLDGTGSVDVALEREGWSVACEISVTSSPEQELGNVRKCFEAGFDEVAVVSTSAKALRNLEGHIGGELEDDLLEQLHFLGPDEFFALLEQREAEAAGAEETVRGYKVKVRYQTVDEGEKEVRKQAISKVIAKAVKRLRGND